MAKATNVGNVYVEIAARLAKLEKGLQRGQRKTFSATRKMQRTINKLNFDRPARSFRRFTRLFTVGLAGYGLGSIASAALDVASSFEQMQIKLDVLTRGRGKETLEALNQWALDMPVNTREAVNTFVMMQAMGLQPTIDKMQILVDVASIFGEESMPRVARALGQMQSLGRLSREELNQLSEVGINAGKILQDTFGATVEEIQKMQMPIENVIEALWSGMNAQTSGAAKKAMGTWRGMVATFKSYMTEMARTVMEGGVFDLIKSALTDINERLKRWVENNREFIAQDIPAVFKAIAGAVTAAAKAFELYDNWTRRVYDAPKGSGTEIYLGQLEESLKNLRERIAELARSNQPGKDDILNRWIGQARTLNEKIAILKNTLVDRRLIDYFGDLDAAAEKFQSRIEHMGAKGPGTAGGGGQPAIVSYDQTVGAQELSRFYQYETLKRDASQETFTAMKADVDDYYNYSVETYERLDSRVDTVFRSASDALADFVTTGKFSFKDFANSVIADLLRINARMALMSLFGGIAGMIGGGGYSLPSGPGDLPPMSFQHGGHIGENVSGVGLRSGRNYRFHANESVVPDGRATAGGGIRVVNHINISAPAGNISSASMSQLQVALGRSIAMATGRNG